MSSRPKGKTAGPRVGNRRPPTPQDRRERSRIGGPSQPTATDDTANGIASTPGGVFDQPPQWFISYMNAFKKEMMADLRKGVVDNIEADKLRRYRKNYFMLRNRYEALERQMNPENGSQRRSGTPPPTTPINGHARAQGGSQNGQAQGGLLADPPPSVSAPETTTTPEATSNSVNGSKEPSNIREENIIDNSIASSEIQEETIVDNSNTSSEIQEKTIIDSSTASSKIKEENIIDNSNASSEVDNCGEASNVNDSGESSELVEGQADPQIEVASAELTSPVTKPTETISAAAEAPTIQTIPMKMESLLNQVTPLNFHKVLEEMKNLRIESKDDERTIISQFFRKAVDAPMYARIYAVLCKQFVLAQPNILHYRSHIISSCNAEIAMQARRIDSETELNEESKKNYLAVVLFIGELHNEDLLCDRTLYLILRSSLESASSMDIECFHELLKNVVARGNKIPPYYNEIWEICGTRVVSPSRTSMIIDTLDLSTKREEVARNDSGDEIDVFSFTEILEQSYIADRKNFKETFYKKIQPQFNPFEFAHYIKELLNSSLQKAELSDACLEIFNKDEGNKIVEWVGGTQVYLDILLRELKILFENFEEIYEAIPQVHYCFFKFLPSFVTSWHEEVSPKNILELLEKIKKDQLRKRWGRSLLRMMVEKLTAEDVRIWLSRGGVEGADFVGSEIDIDMCDY